MAKTGRERGKPRWRALREELEALARDLSYTVRYDSKMTAPGGFCLLKGQRLIVINSRLPEEEQTCLFAEALRRESAMDGVYLRPGVRALMERLEARNA